MTSIAKRFAVGFSTTALVAVFLNLLPYLRTRGAHHGDGFEVIGFPFTFRRLGGVAGIYEFHITALLADIGLALAVALLVGYTCSRVVRRDDATHPPSSITPVDPASLGFGVGDVVRDVWGNEHTVTAIEPLAEHGIGLIHTRRISDGVVLGAGMMAHGLTYVRRGGDHVA